VCNSLVTFANVAAIETDPTAVNHVVVEVHGQEIALFVNDKRVGQFAADAAVAGKLILGVGPQTSLLLVRLRATPFR
jgi:predicted nuclease with RNAse H fold